PLATAYLLVVALLLAPRRRFAVPLGVVAFAGLLFTVSRSALAGLVAGLVVLAIVRASPGPLPVAVAGVAAASAFGLACASRASPRAGQGGVVRRSPRGRGRRRARCDPGGCRPDRCLRRALARLLPLVGGGGSARAARAARARSGTVAGDGASMTIDPRVDLSHVHLKVSDLDRALEFWHDVL